MEESEVRLKKLEEDKRLLQERKREEEELKKREREQHLQDVAQRRDQQIKQVKEKLDQANQQVEKVLSQKDAKRKQKQEEGGYKWEAAMHERNKAAKGKEDNIDKLAEKIRREEEKYQ